MIRPLLQKITAHRRGAVWALALPVVVLALAACSRGVPQEQVDAKDREIAGLRSQMASLQADSTYW